jgi:predicted dehydrogenase
VEEDGVCESLKGATKDAVEFRELEVPERFYPPGGSKRESWRSLFYANLTASFATEILGGGPENEGSFEDGAHVQELINAVERSFRERRWVSIPLDGEP